ncbi:MAG: elongation factor G [Anaerolineales bacterium]|nr:elongation factor G [Anaerolineales bacterium]
MKEYTTEFIRNVALVSHGGAGKTMLAEAFLHVTGATTRLGKVEDGTTVSDYDEEERKRKISIYTSVVPIEYKDYKINLLDAPGYTDFVGEMISALSVADGAIILIDAVAGIEVGAELAWRYCDQFNLPRFIVINKMDRDNADFQKTYDAVQEFVEAHGKRVIKAHLPIGEKQDFKGVADVIEMKAYFGEGKEESEIPAELKEEVDKARVEMLEDAAEGEDALMEKYLESGALTDEEMKRGLENGITAGDFVPVFCAASGREIGMIPLLDGILDLIPSPAHATKRTAQGKDGAEELQPSNQSPLAAYVWKTTVDPFVGKMTYFRVFSGSIQADAHVWNQNKNADERMSGLHFQRGKEVIAAKTVHAGDIAAVSKLTTTSTGDTFCDKGHPLTIEKPKYPAALYRVAVAPKTQADAAKISTVLTRLSEEDPTLTWQNDNITRETVLQGMGDQHIDAAVNRAQTKFQVGIETREPKIPYREGITKKAQAQYRHKKQSGGAGQFGEVHLRIEPFMEGDFDFVDALVGMNLSRSYLPPIEKSIRATMERGAFAGYPMSNVRVTVYDGKEHEVDSKPVAFEIAGREAFKLAVADAGPVLFEPIMTVRVTCPDANMGDVMSDLNTRRGRVQGTETDRGSTIIVAHVPMAEMLKYTTQIRSLTGGRGFFSMEFDHYDTVPTHIAGTIIEAHRKEMEAKKEE